jgi:hypothetical protein
MKNNLDPNLPNSDLSEFYGADPDSVRFYELCSKAVRTDLEANNPPPEAMNAIFADLGLNIPSDTIAVLPTISKSSLLLKKSIFPAVASVLVFVGAWQANNYLESKNASLSNANQSYVTSNYPKSLDRFKTPINDNAKSIANIPMSSSTDDAEKSRDRKTIGNSVNKARYSSAFLDSRMQVQDENYYFTDSDAGDNSIASADNSNDSKTVIKSREEFLSKLSDFTALDISQTPNRLQLSDIPTLNSKSYSLNSPQFNAPTYSLANIAKLRSGYSLHLRGIAGSTGDGEFAMANQFANSYSIGVYTYLNGNDRLQIGLEGGKENFEKQYFDKEEPNRKVSVSYPSIFWGGVGVKYIFADLELANQEINLFGHALLGAGEIGPMGRAMIGASSEVFSGFNVFVGAEAAATVYNNKANWISSNKFNFSAGVFFNL